MAKQMTLQSFSHLESMVSKPTWKEVLLELISSNRIDPWNIDLTELSDAFIRKVKEMEKMEFGVPANIILASAILLKYKSDYLKFLSYQSELAEFDAQPVETGPLDIEALPEISFAARIPPKRQVSLEELVVEMERVIKYDTEPRLRVPRGTIVDFEDLELPDNDIERDIEDILARVEKNSDSEGWSMFSGLRGNADLQQTVYLLLCLLYLVQRGAVDLRQDEMFGEIFIRFLGNKK